MSFILPLTVPLSNITNSDDEDVRYGTIPATAITAATWRSHTYQTGAVTTYDQSTGTGLYTDRTTTVALGTGTGMQVFGTTGTMTAGDALFVRPQAADRQFNRVSFRVTTPGVGTWTIRVQRYNAGTDAWENQTISTDTTDAFRNAGVGYIEFTSTVFDAERLQFGETKYPWTKIELLSVSSVTTAPSIDRLVLSNPDFISRNILPSVRDGNFSSFMTEIFPTDGSYFLITSPGRPVGSRLVISTLNSTVITTADEYYGSDGQWHALTVTNDPSNNYSTLGTFEHRWLVPNDWVSMTLTHASGDVTGFHYRHVITSVPSAFVVPAHIQESPRALGSTSSGMPLAFGATVNHATYNVRGSTSATDVVYLIANATTGQSATFTIPANSRSSTELTNHRATLTGTITYVAGDEMLLAHLGGGALTDFELLLHIV